MPRSDGGSSDWSLVSGKVRPGEEVGTQTEVAPTPSTSSGGVASSGPSGGFLAQARIQAARATQAIQGWTLFIKAFRKIRKYQRYFHNTGERLKFFSEDLRKRIAIAYPKR